MFATITLPNVDFDEAVELLRALPNTSVLIASEDNGAPESNWGNAFVSYVPQKPSTRPPEFPFATVVLRDMEGDESSRVSRPGVYRLNLAVGRELLAERGDADASPDVLDRWIPHPVYATQGWISILSPSPERRAEVEEMIRTAHERARARLDR